MFMTSWCSFVAYILDNTVKWEMVCCMMILWFLWVG